MVGVGWVLGGKVIEIEDSLKGQVQFEVPRPLARVGSRVWVVRVWEVRVQDTLRAHGFLWEQD